MQLPWQNIQGFSGATAVGALTLVGLVLIANSFASNLLPAIDFYARTATWAIVVAVPVVALTYLLGLIATGAAEALLVWRRLVDANVLIDDQIAVSGHGELISGYFQQLHQEAGLLAGGSIGLSLLGLGAALSAWAASGWWRFLASVAIAAIALAIASIALARFRHGTAHRLAIAARAAAREGACAH